MSKVIRWGLVGAFLLIGFSLAMDQAPAAPVSGGRAAAALNQMTRDVRFVVRRDKRGPIKRRVAPRRRFARRPIHRRVLARRRVIHHRAIAPRPAYRRPYLRRRYARRAYGPGPAFALRVFGATLGAMIASSEYDDDDGYYEVYPAYPGYGFYPGYAAPYVGYGYPY